MNVKEAVEKVKALYPDLTFDMTKVIKDSLIVGIGEKRFILVSPDPPSSIKIRGTNKLLGWNDIMPFNCVVRRGLYYVVINMKAMDFLDWVKFSNRLALNLWVKGRA